LGGGCKRDSDPGIEHDQPVIFGLVVILEQWGFNVRVLVAGLGVLNPAVALAAQDVLNNIIAYFAIGTDAPFKMGNLIALGATLIGISKGMVCEQCGVVERGQEYPICTFLN
jgi:small-conductance mechanosensitive channel